MQPTLFDSLEINPHEAPAGFIPAHKNNPPTPNVCPKIKNMKAEVKYSNGWVLVVPKYGHAPMLFMEWLSQFPAGKNWLHKIIQNLDDCFSIRLNMKKEQYEQAAQYINDNL